MIEFSFWAWFGTLSLIILTYEDFKNNMTIDDRRNHLMHGVTLVLLTLAPYSLWYKLMLAAIVLILLYFLRKGNYFGDGDNLAFVWIFLGYMIYGWYVLVGFVALMIVMLFLYWLIRKLFFKELDKTPFFHVILMGYFINSLFFGLY